MKSIAHKCRVIISAFSCSFATAEETQIRVLALVTPSADINVATASLPVLVDTWNNSGNPNGTAIILTNAGVRESILIGGSGSFVGRFFEIRDSNDLVNCGIEDIDAPALS